MEYNKTIKTPSAQLLKSLHENDKQFFTAAEAKSIMGQSSPGAVLQLLRQMVTRGLLLRIKKGVYNVVPYEKDPDIYRPDWHTAVKHLAGKTDYYIGYQSALSLHSLTTQPVLKEQVVVNRQMSPTEILVKDIRFQLIFHNKSHFFGQTSIWVDNFTRVKCSDLEKTITDCLFMSKYAGGIVEIAKAIFKTKDRLDYDKLYLYIKTFNSQAVLKRLGFLLELLEINIPLTQLDQPIKQSA